MRQGEIWNVSLGPVKGSEQAGYRPVVIISGNLLNTYLPVAIVIPLTSKIKNYKGNPILVPDDKNGFKTASEMLVFQIRSISKDRLAEKLGEVDQSIIQDSVKTLNDILKF